MGEVGGEGRGGEGPPAAAECLRLREDRSREGRRRSEEERGNLPPDCARSLGGEKVRQNFPGPREAGRQEMRAAGRGGRKGPCDGRGRSRRRRPRLPHPPGRAAARGAGGGGSAGRAAGGGEECAREARGRTAGRRGGGPGAGGGGGGGVRAGERRNLEPELRGWRRAGLGDVTALESAECRAAGAPCAGPGEVAHFWCGGFGKCLKAGRGEMNTSFRDAVPALLVTTVDHTGSDLSSLDMRQMRSRQILVFAMKTHNIQPVGFPLKSLCNNSVYSSSTF
ncbi:translation initiation factor IF-2-like isoform X2 [Lutra lutra]|uniref:translation initiation factor IF-2-like isoform X2 n=1 Tax=Lutra lutra TaxID=9657 RepID=UPI001FD1C5E2|nr:translation initiation factor IF-2-like isoform X2 [Lutra lutra]